MEEELKKLLEENLALTREMHATVAKVRRYMLWQRVVSTIYFILIVGPLIVAAIYLPPLIKPLWQQYQSLSDLFQSSGEGTPGKLPAALENLNARDIQNFIQTTLPPGGKNPSPTERQPGR